MKAKEKLLQIVDTAKGDDLERARLAFGHLSDEDLDKEHGCSGRTRREILRGYEDERAAWQAARALAAAL